MRRRLFLASRRRALAGCGHRHKLNDNDWLHNVLDRRRAQPRDHRHARHGAQAIRDADIDHDFRVNGSRRRATRATCARQPTTSPATGCRSTARSNGRSVFTLAELQAMPQLTQITRHDCVEGWSAIGKWGGVPLGDVLDGVRPRARARYVVFHCMDNDGHGSAVLRKPRSAPSRAIRKRCSRSTSTASRSIPTTARPCGCACRPNSATRARSGSAASRLVGASRRSTAEGRILGR